ncbi:helix-turn-helix domain-containing protein [Streptomyces sp. NPDC001817]|uniref:helix-turn-helix domain-containing protein n=1 Tax=Streptomyces sp. NPDC001817 TaxID=3154398 RepID=UPI0033294782
MGSSDAVRWGPAEREGRRMQAADLFEQGVRQVEVARLLGVSRQAVGSGMRRGGRVVVRRLWRGRTGPVRI